MSAGSTTPARSTALTAATSSPPWPARRGAPTYLFVSHIDTVESGTPPVSPHIDDDGVIRSDGETILGADNKAAVAAVMRVCAAAAAIPEAQRPTVHRRLHLL